MKPSLSIKQREEIHQRIAAGESVRALVREYGTTRQTITGLASMALLSCRAHGLVIIINEYRSVGQEMLYGEHFY